MTPLTGWQNFYVIVGSAAGALIGLQFIVVTLIADIPTLRKPELSSAFSTPTIAHFVIALLLSALAAVPWHGLGPISFLWGLLGLFGTGYSGVVARRLVRQTDYDPVLPDWWYYIGLPFIANLMLATAGFLTHSHPIPAVYVAGGASLLFLFLGIHNAWDSITYHVFVQRGDLTKDELPSSKQT